MNLTRRGMLFAALAMFAGCSGGTVSDTELEVQPVETPVKGMLEGVADRGELGSASMEIRDALQSMKAAGDPKADELLKDLDELERTSGPDRVKKKASEMAAKL